jgi:lipopolysaccharide/colanic/teichoic acid biosynthesis glycosyltransferase
LLLLVAGAPIIGLLVALVRLTSRGPGLYHQVRVGQHGRIFVMYKIRTMVEDAERSGGAQWARINDPRTTRIGRLLRKFHLDELPQLVNVVKGEMAIIGPRPERPELVHVLAQEIPGYYNRLAVLPGITGLAQINLPPDTDLQSVRRKLALDLEYIRTASLWLEWRMVCWTVLRLAGVPYHLATSALGLRRPADRLELPETRPAGQAPNDNALTIPAILSQKSPLPGNGSGTHGSGVNGTSGHGTSGHGTSGHGTSGQQRVNGRSAALTSPLAPALVPPLRSAAVLPLTVPSPRPLPRGESRGEEPCAD